jgi:hypothetical protein
MTNWQHTITTDTFMSNQCRMGKAIACPSDQRIAIDGHVVPPLPILRGIVL